MTKMKTFYYFIVSLVLLSACTTDFEEINTNPNNSDELIQLELLLPSILKESCTRYFENTLSRSIVVCDYHEDPFTSMFGSAFDATDTERYYFTGLTDIQSIVDSANVDTHPHLLGIGLTLKSWMFQVLTDIYGDFPYSQALKNKSEEIRYPAYDRQEAIYYDLLVRLEEANTLLAKPANEVISKDILLNGNMKRWQMFANGLRIRLLMRMSGVNNLKIDISRELQEIVSDPAKYPLFESNGDNVVFTFLNEEGNFAPSYTKTPADFNGSYFLSTTLETNLKALNDTRIHIYASPTRLSVEQGNPLFAGVPNCLNEGDEQNYNGGDHQNSTMSNLFLNRNIDPVLASPTALQTIILTYSEIQLHLAEARERGLITTGDAALYYQNGIRASFDYWASRIPAHFTYPKTSDVSPPETYFTQPEVAYTGSQAERLHKIYLQKWLALYFCGFEGWSEWRRTGVPTQISVSPPAPYHSNSSIAEWPRRIPYPMYEETYNNKNYSEAVARQGADNLTTRVWWNP
jgi:hypothetical protein